MALITKNKFDEIDFLSGISSKPTPSPITQPEEGLSLGQKVLTNPAVSSAIDFLSGKKSLKETETIEAKQKENITSLLKPFTDIPKHVKGVGEFVARPFIPEDRGGRPNTFSDFAQMIEEEAFPIVSAPFASPAGAITSAIHAPKKDPKSLIRSVMEGIVKPQEAPPLLKGVDIGKLTGVDKFKGIGVDKPLTEFERGGKTKIGATARLIPRALLQAGETVALGYMLGIPRATKKAVGGRIKKIKNEGITRDIHADLRKIDPAKFMKDIEKQGLFPKKATQLEKMDMSLAVLERFKAELETNPKIRDVYAKKQTTFQPIGKKIKSKKGELLPEKKVTDPAEVQKIKNSIQEGELILKSGKTSTGIKMTKEQLGSVQRAVDNSKAKIEVEEIKLPPHLQKIADKAKEFEIEDVTPKGFEPAEPGKPEGEPKKVKFTSKEAMEFLNIEETGKAKKGGLISISSTQGKKKESKTIGQESTQTGLENIKPTTLSVVTNIAEKNNLPITITGGTEGGVHKEDLLYSHAKGDKIDLRFESKLNEIVEGWESVGIRSFDKAEGFKDPDSFSIFWKEKTHWDVEVRADSEGGMVEGEQLEFNIETNAKQLGITVEEYKSKYPQERFPLPELPAEFDPLVSKDIGKPPTEPPKKTAFAEPEPDPGKKAEVAKIEKKKEISRKKSGLTEIAKNKETDMGSLVEQYEVQKDIWLGNQDVRITLEIPAEKNKLQDAIKKTTGVKKYGDKEKDLDMAIQLAVDNKRNPAQVKELYSKLTDEQKRIVDLSQNLPKGIQSISDRIEKSYKEIGLESQEADVIKNTIDNYAGRIWDVEGKPPTQKFRKFGKTTRHAKQRVFDTIVEGWSKGMELKVKGATNNLSILKEEMVKTIEDKKFIESLEKIKDLEGNPLLTTKQLPGYKRVEHPNFKKWMHAGKAKPGEVYGRNSFVTEDGNLFEKRELFAPEGQASNLNNILGVSKLKGIKTIDTVTKYNAIIKAWVLQTSLFHHLAFSRSYYLGTNRKTFKEMNIIDAVNDGNRMIDELEPIIVHGVRNGLTLGRKQDWSEDLLQEKTAIGSLLNKWGASKVAKDKILDLRQSQADFLFGVVGTGLKAKAYAIEYRNQSKKFPNQDPDVLAKRVAGLINDDFGGLHLKRLGRNPTVQHIFRLLALAPDWTESNIRTMVIALTPTQTTWDPSAGKFRKTDKEKKNWRKEEAEMYRTFWGNIFAKGTAATILANLASAVFDEDDINGKGVLGRFYRNYRMAGREGKYRWLDVDITPLAEVFLGDTPERYYFSILGHFKDPLKLSIRNDKAKKGQRLSTFNLGNSRAMKHKSSIVGGILNDYLTGTDYAERRFTTLKELVGKDEEKGEYKTTRKGKYKKGDPKWGKLKGKTVTWDYGKRGILESEQYPSFLMNKIKGSQPVQVQQLIGYMAGEMDGFQALSNSLGLGVTRTYGGEPDEMTKRAWSKTPLEHKKIQKGKRFIKDGGLWKEITIKGKDSSKGTIPDDVMKKIEALAK